MQPPPRGVLQKPRPSFAVSDGINPPREVDVRCFATSPGSCRIPGTCRPGNPPAKHQTHSSNHLLVNQIGSSPRLSAVVPFFRISQHDPFHTLPVVKALAGVEHAGAA